MRPRPIRSKIYLPVVVLGVVDADWKFVIFFTLLCYSVPFFLDIRLMGFPLEIWTSILGLVLSIAFFNFARMGRRPFWLQHQIKAFLHPSRRRHPLPTDEKARPWLMTEATEQ